MTTKEIEVVAEFFTGPTVAYSSIMLGVGGDHARMAKIFFDAREELGIGGYASKDQALQQLLRSK